MFDPELLEPTRNTTGGQIGVGIASRAGFGTKAIRNHLPDLIPREPDSYFTVFTVQFADGNERLLSAAPPVAVGRPRL